ncbi:MAG TPA: twin-arginine translocase TatA/TatE family subunit [Pseudolysinimonas sp.]|jgi:sec-independent protein translocase protein TatA|nr:twin-arginine translocase TatA/TatE family subunit [Pseudolysinimonas sp.]
MFGNLTGWHFLIVLAIILLLFGATKLPALAKSVGQSMKVFRNEIRSDDKQGEATSEATDAAHVDEASSDKK